MTLALCILLAQTAPAIDFDHKGAPVERVVAAMSEAYKEIMFADVTVHKDFVILALRNETAERARSLVAEALNATWTKKDDVWILHRTSEQFRAEAQKSLQDTIEKLKRIQDGITVSPRVTGRVAEAAVRKIIEDDANSEPRYVGELPVYFPFRRVFERLVKEVPTEFYATRLDDYHNVFSLRGGNGVWKFPQHAREIILEGLRDQSALCDMLDSKAASISLPFGISRAAIDPESLTLVLLGTKDIYSLSARYKSEQGHDNKVYFDLPSTEDVRPPPHKWSSKLDDVFVKSPLFQEWMSLLVGNDPELMRRQPSNELWHMLTGTPHSDHLDLFMNPLVRQAADSSNKSFLVRSPEIGSWSESPINRVSGSQLSHVLRTAFNNYYYGVVERDHEVLILPKDTASLRGLEYDRVAFATVLSALRTEKPIEVLEPISNLLRGLAPRGYNPAVRRLNRASRNMCMEENPSKLSALGLYANLTASQRNLARRGGLEIGIGSLNHEGLNLLRSMTANEVYQGPTGSYDIRDYDGTGVNMNGKSADLEEMVNKSANDLRIIVSVKEKQTLFSRANDQATPNPASVPSAGYEIVSESIESQEQFDLSFAWVPETMVEISVKTTSSPLRIAVTYLHPTMATAEYVKLKDMPQDFQDRIEQEVKRVKKMYGRTGGGTSPPSRR